MAEVIVFDQTGGPEVLRLEQRELSQPGPGQVRIRQYAAGINLADTYFRKGWYPLSLPSGLGVEASGVISAVGQDVYDFKVGDRVCYTGFIDTLGAYSSERLLNAATLMQLPDSISFETAAASTLRGLTAAYLLRRIFAYQPGQSILLHAAAGGLGLIISQWAKLLGLTVIGTVSSAAKAQIAQAHGCDYVIDYSRENVAEAVRDWTRGVGVDVVLDGVGRDTFEHSLAALRPRGLMVCLGTASGPLPAFDLQRLARQGSLFITRPALADYIADPAERQQLAQEWFGHLQNETLKVHIHHRYRLSQAAQAHQALENRQTMGSSIFVIDHESI